MCLAGRPPLLTTRRQLEQWQAGVGGRPMSVAITEAVGAAVAFGHDNSGRFRTVPHWLRHSQADSEEIAPATLTTWEPLAGGDNEEVLVVAQDSGLWAGGLILTVLLCLLAWLVRKTFGERWRFRLLLVWLAAGGLTLFWLPGVLRPLCWGPTLAALLVALSWHLSLAWPGWRAVGADSTNPTSSLPRKGVVAGAAVLLLGWLASWSGPEPAALAGGPEPVTVLLLPPDDDGRQAVLMPPDLLKRLDEMTQRAGPPRGAVLVSARYQGSVHGEAALFTVDFHAQVFDDKATLVIPLNDVELEEGAQCARLPGHPFVEPEFAAVHPQATPQGYAVSLQGRGQHLIRLHFRVRLAALADQREIRCLVPKLAQSWVELQLPPGAHGGWAVTAQGQQTFEVRPRPRLNADLGREGLLQLRWRQDQPGLRPAVVSVRETYLWDLRPAHSHLAAALHYTVGSGLVSQFQVVLPEGAEVRGVEVTAVGKTADSATPPRLKGWQVAVGTRQLRVDLQTPVSGEVLVTLSLAPRLTGMGRLIRLNLPRPLGVTTANGAIGYRVDGLQAKDEGIDLTLDPINPDAFAQRLGGGGPTERAPGNPRLSLSPYQAVERCPGIGVANAAAADPAGNSLAHSAPVRRGTGQIAIERLCGRPPARGVGGARGGYGDRGPRPSRPLLDAQRGQGANLVATAGQGNDCHAGRLDG